MDIYEGYEPSTDGPIGRGSRLLFENLIRAWETEGPARARHLRWRNSRRDAADEEDDENENDDDDDLADFVCSDSETPEVFPADEQEEESARQDKELDGDVSMSEASAEIDHSTTSLMSELRRTAQSFAQHTAATGVADLQCTACRTNKRDICFSPCNHVPLCAACVAASLQEAALGGVDEPRCPLCQTVVAGVHQVRF